MHKLSRILMQKYPEIVNIVNNDNKDYISNNDINDNNGTENEKDSKYRLDRTKFSPNTEGSQLAEEIATELNDLKNYACYFDIVNKIGIERAKRLLASVLDDIQVKLETKTPVRNKGAYFVNKYKRGGY